MRSAAELPPSQPGSPSSRGFRTAVGYARAAPDSSRSMFIGYDGAMDALAESRKRFVTRLADVLHHCR